MPPPLPQLVGAETVFARCNADASRDAAVWIHRLTLDELRAAAVAAAASSSDSLRGLTFAIKDNIDLAGAPTTAACPGFAYVAARSASVVERLIAAGALPVGKTNLDQFATGLVGTRSPYGAPRNVYNADYISGGSSSGSAVAVAAGLVDVAIGTDTAGSMRVPAAFNGIVGIKPTRGRLSTRGVVPACRSLDCVGIFANTIDHAVRVLDATEGFDPDDPFSRQEPAGQVRPVRRLGVPRGHQLDWFGNSESANLFGAAIERIRSVGAEIVEVDFAAFLEAATLLYEGPWTAERYAAVGEFIERHSQSDADVLTTGLDPTVSAIILGGKSPSAVDAFRALYRLAELRRTADTILATVDALVAPTAGTIYRVSEVEADPVRLNANLGRYTNFMNLLDLCGVAVPAGRYSMGPGFGITLIAPAWHDRAILEFAARYLGETAPASPVPSAVTLAVCGAHLRGQPLHAQLTAIGAQFESATTTAPDYRLYALANTSPAKPGLVRVSPGQAGSAIAVETYSLSHEAFGRFVSAVPAPLVIGTATLADGTTVKSFLCEPAALIGATDITSHGGWVAYLRART